MNSIIPFPSDQQQRDRFEKELGKNFSVIAPAGVGKTESIVRRVVFMATHDITIARPGLPKLAVVTYTNRAANEMQYRARNEILKRGVDPEILGSFNRAFFGTIHQYCLGLLRTYGYHLGLPRQLDLVEDEDALWLEFVRSLTDIDSSLSKDVFHLCLKHLSFQDLLAAGRSLRPGEWPVDSIGPYPNLDYETLLNHPPNNRSKGKVEEGQRIIRDWLKNLEAGLSPLPIPKYEAGGDAFKNCWKDTFAPLQRWLGQCTVAIAIEISKEFLAYRLSKGQLTYDDQIALAAQLVTHPTLGKSLREEGRRIILDEAQDTDPLQFRVLLELARPPEASGDWLETGEHPPRAGHFSMVGDFEQSIYGKRADLSFYSKVHQSLTHSMNHLPQPLLVKESNPVPPPQGGRLGGGEILPLNMGSNKVLPLNKGESEGVVKGEELIFSVTFRCDQNIIDAVNRFGPNLLDGKEGQADYVPLLPRPNAGQGQVIRWKAECPPEYNSKTPVDIKASLEATQLAEWILEQGLEKLRAPCWSEVAILCPRKRWFAPLARALKKVGLKVQVQSTKAIQGDSPAYAWLTALMVVFAEPDNSFELVGVLREIFGLSDQQLADYSEGNGAIFNIDDPPILNGPVSETLNYLAIVRKEILNLPLRDAVERIIEATALRERLQVLPDHSAELLTRELNGLLLQASTVEFERMSLDDWAEKLKLGFLSLKEEEPVQEDCIQLISCHKAKGLEWHTVILPGFYRPIYSGAPNYPRLLYQGQDAPPIFAFSKLDIPDAINDSLTRSMRHEIQRILYVSMTRAKKSLVLADSSTIYGSPSNTSFAGLLGLTDPDIQKVWEDLPEKLQVPPPGGGRLGGGELLPLNKGELEGVIESKDYLPQPLLVKEGSKVPPPGGGRLGGGELLPLNKGELEGVIESKDYLPQPLLAKEGGRISHEQLKSCLFHAGRFPERILPSRLAHHAGVEEPEFRNEKLIEDVDSILSLDPELACSYGSWWHEMMEKLDWQEGPEGWESVFNEALLTCQQPERAKEEWEIFLNSGLAHRLTQGAWVIHAEMPVFLKQEDGNCLEGIIDLAALDQNKNQWLVIDWKTDQIDKENVLALVDRYRPQIEAYLAALNKITGLPATGALYSTRTGMLLNIQ